MKTRRALLCLALACLAPAVPAAGPPRPFDATTPGELARYYAGRAYVLAFWSLECGHCQAELAGFARLLRTNPDLPLELVAADPPEAAAAVAERLAALGLDPGRHWHFADSVQERVRFAVDRRWRGELPRTYLFDAEHRPRAISGALGEDELRAWLAREPRRVDARQPGE